MLPAPGRTVAVPRRAAAALVLLLGACGRGSGEQVVGAGQASPSTPASGAVIDARLESTSLGWALTPGTLYVTTDQGASWKPMAVPTAPQGDQTVAMTDAQHAWVASVVTEDLEDGAPPRRVRVDSTCDGGASWQRVTLPPLASYGDPGSVRLVFDRGVGALLVGHVTSSNFSTASLFSTTDGLHWAQHPAPIGGVFALEAPSRVWIAGGAPGDQLWTSTDLGATWSQVVLPGLAPQTFSFGVPTFGFSGRVLALTINGPTSEEAFYTSSDGITWVPAGSVRVDVSTGVGGALAASVAGGSWFVLSPMGDQLFVTNDRGRTFATRRPRGLPGGAVDIEFLDGNVGWARAETVRCTQGKSGCSTTRTLHVTRDGGQTWNTVGF